VLYLLFPAATGEFEMSADLQSVTLQLLIPWSSRGKGIGTRLLPLTGQIGGDLPKAARPNP
jgi:hypothetical protein